MNFRKVWYDGAAVRLEWDEQLPKGATDKHVYHSNEPPTGAFKGALAAFSPFVVGLLGLPLEWSDCEVRSLSPKEEEDGRRGLQVTILRKIADAKNRPVVITTPYLAAAPADYTGDGKGYLTPEVLKLLALCEREAEGYKNGERAQLELMESDNAKEFDERAAAAEVGSTRKPRGKAPSMAQKETSLPELNEVGVVMSNAQLRTQMAVKGFDVPADAIERWTSTERDGVIRWLTAPSDTVLGQAVPECVNHDATGALFSDETPGPDYEIEGAKGQ